MVMKQLYSLELFLRVDCPIKLGLVELISCCKLLLCLFINFFWWVVPWWILFHLREEHHKSVLSSTLPHCLVQTVTTYRFIYLRESARLLVYFLNACSGQGRIQELEMQCRPPCGWQEHSDLSHPPCTAFQGLHWQRAGGRSQSPELSSHILMWASYPPGWTPAPYQRLLKDIGIHKISEIPCTARVINTEAPLLQPVDFSSFYQ